MAQKDVNDMAASVMAPANRTARNMSTSSDPVTKPESVAAASTVPGRKVAVAVAVKPGSIPAFWSLRSADLDLDALDPSPDVTAATSSAARDRDSKKKA